MPKKNGKAEKGKVAAVSGRVIVEQSLECNTFRGKAPNKVLVHSVARQYGTKEFSMKLDFGTVDAIKEGKSSITIEKLAELAAPGIIISMQNEARTLAKETVPNPKYDFKETVSIADWVNAPRKTGRNRAERDASILNADRARIVEKLMAERGMTMEEATALVS